MADEELRRVGRYVLHRQIAAGGMATVHIGRLVGPAGFSRTVAIKRLHAEYAHDPYFVAMFLDEARIAARIAHPNIVSTLDVVAQRGELFLVMDYVEGAALSGLITCCRERGRAVELDLAVGIMVGALAGLHAAHEAFGEDGAPLSVIHRDVSPHNVLVGVDGIPRVADFGIAKAVGRLQSTTGAKLKGKLGYMAPELIRGESIDRRVDVYASAIVLWELLAGRKLFTGPEAVVVCSILDGDVRPPSSIRPDVSPSLEAVIMRGLARDPSDRFSSAAEMAQALEAAHPMASARRIGSWVAETAAALLELPAKLREELERSSGDAPPISAPRPRAAVDGATRVEGRAQDAQSSASTDASLPRPGGSGRRS